MNVEKLEQLYNKEIQKISDEINKSEEERIEKLSHLKTFGEKIKNMSFLSKEWFSIKKWWKEQSVEFKILSGISYFTCLLMLLFSIIILNTDIASLTKFIFLSTSIPFSLIMFFNFIDDIKGFKNKIKKSDKSIKESLRNKTEELLENEMKKPISMHLMKVFREAFENEKHLENFMIGNGSNEINYEKIKNIIEYKKDYKKVKTMIESIKQEEVML